uniref:BHLH domain-containing protein n=1 Tax=Kalanchoe fedtschenkoi TaxID=63787 RepID=A0A7N0UB48_KALFE
MEKDDSLDTDVDISSADEAPASADKTASRSKKNQVKVPKKINKARREKLKREQLNDLFLDLAKALDIKEPNKGKASILTEASRFLNGMLIRVDRLRKENKTLTAESQYVTVEKKELEEDNSLLLSEVERLRGEIESKKLQSQPVLNAPPPDIPLPHQPGPLLSKDHLGFVVPDPAFGQPQLPCPLIVIPLSSNYPNSNADHPQTNQTSVVSKPSPRYPNQMGSWKSQSQILEQQLLRTSKTN